MVMDKDRAIEAARALVWKLEYAYPANKLPELKALKEALEDKPGNEDCIARLAKQRTIIARLAKQRMIW